MSKTNHIYWSLLTFLIIISFTPNIFYNATTLTSILSAYIIFRFISSSLSHETNTPQSWWLKGIALSICITLSSLASQATALHVIQDYEFIFHEAIDSHIFHIFNNELPHQTTKDNMSKTYKLIICSALFFHILVILSFNIALYSSSHKNLTTRASNNLKKGQIALSKALYKDAILVTFLLWGFGYLCYAQPIKYYLENTSIDSARSLKLIIQMNVLFTYFLLVSLFTHYVINKKIERKT